MNPKIDKLARDIEKTEKKIADLQKKLELFREEKPGWRTRITAILAVISTSPRRSWQNF